MIEQASSIKPCVGCGYCCITVTCVIGMELYDIYFQVKGFNARCPGLYWNGKRYRCKAIEKEELFSEALGKGEGCCSPLNSWRIDVKER